MSVAAETCPVCLGDGVLGYLTEDEVLCWLCRSEMTVDPELMAAFEEDERSGPYNEGAVFELMKTRED